MAFFSLAKMFFFARLTYKNENTVTCITYLLNKTMLWEYKESYNFSQILNVLGGKETSGI